MLIVFRLQPRVDAWLAARGRVEVPRPSRCPGCGGSWLTFDGWRPRQTRRGRVWIRRVVCTAVSHGPGQERWHSLVPDVLVAGRVDLASVIGWALQHRATGWGFRRIAAELGVPEDTVRGWLRRVERRGQSVAGRLVAAAAAADPGGRDPPASAGVFVLLVAAATLAATAYGRLCGEPTDRWRHAVMVCGSRLLG